MRAERRLVLVIAVIAVVVVVLDQLTKLVVLDRLAPGAPVTVVPGLVALTLVMNPGLAFGLLAGVPPGWRWIVVPLSLLALLVLLRVALRILPTGGWRERSAIGLVFGGAVGNLIDRARFGAVVDFVDVHFRGYHWPAFNVADSAITIGVAMLALAALADRSPSTPA
ncbi:MAG: signal peptidase II [Candidatus Rokuibacteriota bacterium]|nr:MAG: signal peptidase II [Candidatus Rokubacteria bacterium]PYN72993.1 MAG: signal peptidase II [Candidatus Rokubacteria bacterium]